MSIIKSVVVPSVQFPLRRNGVPSTKVISRAAFAVLINKIVPIAAEPLLIVVQLSVAAAASVSTVIKDEVAVNVSLDSVAVACGIVIKFRSSARRLATVIPLLAGEPPTPVTMYTRSVSAAVVAAASAVNFVSAMFHL